MNGLKWKTYQRMDANRAHGNLNRIIGKHNTDINC